MLTRTVPKQLNISTGSSPSKRTCGAHSSVSSAVGGTGSTWPSASWVTQSKKGLPADKRRAGGVGMCSELSCTERLQLRAPAKHAVQAPQAATACCLAAARLHVAE